MILGLGHPRTGTGFTSKLCQMWGLDVGHEYMGDDGIIDWHLVKASGPYPYHKGPKFSRRPEHDMLIYNIRHPKDTIPSVVFTEDTNKSSLKYREPLFTIPYSNKVERAIASIIAFDDIISAMKPDITYRIEDQQTNLFEVLVEDHDIEYEEYNTPYNTREHRTLDDALCYYDVSIEHQLLINVFCDKYGYTPIDFKGG